MEKNKDNDPNPKPTKGIPTDPGIYNKVSGARHLELRELMAEAFTNLPWQLGHNVNRLVNVATESLPLLTALSKFQWEPYRNAGAVAYCRFILSQLAKSKSKTEKVEELLSEYQTMMENYQRNQI